MLVEGLIRGRATLKEHIRIVKRLRPLIRIIVLHLMVVPGHETRNSRVQTLQVGIESILRITVAITVQRVGLNTVTMEADRWAAGLNEFVNVIAKENDKIGLLIDQMAIGREVSGFVVRAGNERKSELIERLTRRRCGHGAADTALRIATGESIPIRTIRCEALNLKVDRMGVAGFGEGGSASDNAAHCVVGRDLVDGRNVATGHAAGDMGIHRQGIGCKPRP